jgi:DNA-binding NarL/FixJ family response regulator
MVTVIVADDHPAPRAGIVQAVSQDPNIQVIGEASNGPEVWKLLAKSVPDVLLLDINMPGFAAFVEAPKLIDQYPEMAILIVTAYDNEEYVRSLVQAGVYGYIRKDVDVDTYVEAVHEVAQKRTFFSNGILQVALSNGPGIPALTEREQQVLRLIARGYTSEQIAHELNITKRTADFHARNIMQKFDVDSRRAAATKALEMKLISAWRET